MVLSVSAYGISKWVCQPKKNNQTLVNVGYGGGKGGLFEGEVKQQETHLHTRGTEVRHPRCLQTVMVGEVFVALICLVGALLAMGSPSLGFLTPRSAQILFGAAIIDALLVIGISVYACPKLRESHER